jgi:hypothetical protein
MINLEFGDAMRRLRDGEILVASRPKHQHMTVIWDSRGLWTYSMSAKWVIVKEPLDLIMSSTWSLDPDYKPHNPLPVGPVPEQ